MKSLAPALLALVSVTAIGAVAGCAQGTTDVDLAEDSLAATPADESDEEAEEEPESVKLPPASTPSDSDEEEEEADADADAGAPDADAGTGTKPDGGADAGPTNTCNASNTCAGATDLGQVSGDLGADVETAEGHGSQWLKVRVTENDNGLLGVQLWMTATLTSPPGANFDLYVYVPTNDTLECSAVTYKSTSTSGDDTVAARFGESGAMANGVDDARTVTVEVRHVSGSCDPSKKWKLTLAGNE